MGLSTLKLKNFILICPPQFFTALHSLLSHYLSNLFMLYLTLFQLHYVLYCTETRVAILKLGDQWKKKIRFAISLRGNLKFAVLQDNM